MNYSLLSVEHRVLPNITVNYSFKISFLIQSFFGVLCAIDHWERRYQKKRSPNSNKNPQLFKLRVLLNIFYFEYVTLIQLTTYFFINIMV